MHVSGTTLVNLGQISDIPSLCLRGTCACYLLSHLTKAYIRHNPQTTNLILLTFATLHNTVLVVNILILIVEKEFTIKRGVVGGHGGVIFGRRPHSRGYRGGTPEKIFNFFFKNQKLTYRYKKSRSLKYLRTPVWLWQAFKNLLGQYDPPPWEIGLEMFN